MPLTREQWLKMLSEVEMIEGLCKELLDPPLQHVPRKTVRTKIFQVFIETHKMRTRIHSVLGEVE